MSKIKEPNFLYIGAEQKKIVQKINDSHFLDLHTATNIDLFLFAMSLGMETLPTEVKQKETFIRDEYVRTKHDAFLYSLYIFKMENKEDLEAIKNKDKIYELAEKYANTGFDLINDLMKTKSESVVELELVKELDQAYDKLFF